MAATERRYSEALNKARDDLKESQEKHSADRLNFNNKMRSETLAFNQKVAFLLE